MNRSALHEIALVSLLGTISTPALGAADLGVEVAVDSPTSAPVVAHEPFDFVVLVEHLEGRSTAREVRVSSELSDQLSLLEAVSERGACFGTGPVICDVGDLEPGESRTIVVEVVADVSDSSARLESTASSLTPDPEPANDLDVASVEVVEPSQAADLEMSLRDRPDPVTRGRRVSYLATVVNNGPASARFTDVDVTVSPLSLRELDRVTSAAGRCSSALDSCSSGECDDVEEEPLEIWCDIPSITPGGTVTVELVAIAARSAGSELQVRASAFSRGVADPDHDDNVATERTRVVTSGVVVGGGSGGTCFFSTILSGSPLARGLTDLRRFRDEHLRSSRAGRTVIGVYYDLFAPPVDLSRTAPACAGHGPLDCRAVDRRLHVSLAGLPDSSAPCAGICSAQVQVGSDDADSSVSG